MKQCFALMLMFVAGCAPTTTYMFYQEPSGSFSAEVPDNWPKDYDDAFTRKPIASVSWIGKLIDGRSGVEIGAIIEVRKLWRQSTDHPTPEDFERYRQKVLEPTGRLFDGTHPADVRVEETTINGRAARSFSRNIEQTSGGGIHGKIKRYPSRVEGVVFQTKEAYYVIEYRATNELFEKYLPVFERLKSSFQLNAKSQ